MIILDAHLPPALATWLRHELGLEAATVRDLQLRDADDRDIFAAARRLDAIVMTKDADFAAMVERFGPPPKVIWLTCGNTTNAHLRQLLRTTLPRALELLNAGERLIEIR